MGADEVNVAVPEPSTAAANGLEKFHEEETKNGDIGNYILCIAIHEFSRTTQFIWCCVCIFVFYVFSGYFQELQFTPDEMKPHGWYITLIQFGLFSIFAYIDFELKKLTRRIPLYTYYLLAVLTLGTMGLSNASLTYLNYTTAVIFKCCKLLPVMAGSVLLQGKRYGIIDVFAAICMCVGLAFFTIADQTTSLQFSFTGVVLMLGSLVCDALIGNVQEKSMKTLRASNAEVVLFSYGIGFFYLFFVLLATGDLLAGIEYGAIHPWEMYAFTFFYSAPSYLGIQVVLTMVCSFGALAAATVTTARKAVTIALSFIVFTKPFSSQYLWSGGLVLLGISLNVFSSKFSDLSLLGCWLLRRKKPATPTNVSSNEKGDSKDAELIVL